MMTKTEFLNKYGDATVKFEGYYKYIFTFSGKLENGDTITVSIGGDADAIYRLDIGTGIEKVNDLDPISGNVWRFNPETYKHDSIASFQDY